MANVCSILYCFASNCFFTKTTTSLPFSFFFLMRKLSLISRLIRLRSTAFVMFLFDTASPSLAKFLLLSIAKNKKNLSLERLWDENAAVKSFEHLSLLRNRKRSANEVADIGIDVLCREALSSFFSPCLYYLSSCTALHSRTKAVVSFAFKFAWLIRLFHSQNLICCGTFKRALMLLLQ